MASTYCGAERIVAALAEGTNKPLSDSVRTKNSDLPKRPDGIRLVPTRSVITVTPSQKMEAKNSQFDVTTAPLSSM